MTPIRLLVPLLCLFATVSNALAQEAQRAKWPPPSLDAIDAEMQKFVDTGVISGAVTLVGHKGKIIHLGAVGFEDIETKKKMTWRSLFSIASMTKPIVASGIMLLEEEGKLSVDDPVSQFLPAFANLKLADGSSPAREITIHDALTHTSGLSGNQVFAGSLEEAVNELAEKPLAFEPGSKWQYSPGLNVAGRIIEVVSKQPLDTFLKERIFAPLEMNNATFFPDEQQSQRIAKLYKLSEDKTSLEAIANRITQPSENAASQRGANPSGGLFASAVDMFRFYQMVLGGGELRKTRLLSADSVARMTTKQTGDLVTGFTPGNGWGLGWCIVQEPQGVSEMLNQGTFGHGGAFGTQGWVDPKTKTIYVLLIQRNDLGNSDGSDIRKTFQQVASQAIGSE
jgi:CubicO group peptidase (beta-lactamase class C family)